MCVLGVRVSSHYTWVYFVSTNVLMFERLFLFSFSAFLSEITIYYFPPLFSIQISLLLVSSYIAPEIMTFQCHHTITIHCLKLFSLS
jgi:hypothetical protein